MLAIDGGTAIRDSMLNYGFQTIDEDDKQAVLEVLNDNKFLTTGPKVIEFEEKIKDFCGAKYACAVNSGTAALHLAVDSLNLKNTDEVIVTCMSFVASANCIEYCNAKPVFCDIEEDTMNIDIQKIEDLITPNTKAIIAVDFAGQPCDYHKLKQISNKYNLTIIQDAAHSFGCQIKTCNTSQYVGGYADITTLSFHPVKNMTTCEGGMCLTNNELFYQRMKQFRTHGINKTFADREKNASHFYQMESLGFNYRIPDILCALGISQLNKLPNLIKRRQEIAKKYDKKLKFLSEFLDPLTQKWESACHIYIIKLNLDKIKTDRDMIFKALRAEGIGVNVHYMPIHLHPYYLEKGTFIGQMPIAEKVYKQIITLPIYPLMNDSDIDDVINALQKVINHFKL